MNVIVSLEHRFEGTPDGKIWTKTAGDYKFWSRYLEVFDTVRVLTRVKNVESAVPGSVRADGMHVSFIRVPHYIGPYQYLLKSVQIKNTIHKAFAPDSAVILRVPGQISNCLELTLKAYGYPYAVEVVGDPYDVFAPGSIRTLFRPFFRKWITSRLRLQCKNAIAASYVTREALQARYPCDKYSKDISDVELPGQPNTLLKKTVANYSSNDMNTSAFSNEARTHLLRNDGCVELVTVGSLGQLYKAPDVLIDAIHKCISSGLKIELNIVGDGAFRGCLVEKVKQLGLSNSVHFLGEITAGVNVRKVLDNADIFILPSRTEGLPRAMIEAMARGLPCIGSTAGGIPELLLPEEMVPPGDATALAGKIREVATDPERMWRMSQRNLLVSYEYKADILQKKRYDFYWVVMEVTGAWLSEKAFQ